MCSLCSSWSTGLPWDDCRIYQLVLRGSEGWLDVVSSGTERVFAPVYPGAVGWRRPQPPGRLHWLHLWTASTGSREGSARSDKGPFAGAFACGFGWSDGGLRGITERHIVIFLS